MRIPIASCRAVLLSLFVLVAAPARADEPLVLSDLDWIPSTEAGLCHGAFAPSSALSAVTDELTVTADHSRILEDGRSLLEGNVVIDGSNRRLVADRVSIDSAKGEVLLQGNALWRDSQLVVQADRALINQGEGSFDMEAARFRIYRGNVRGAATRLFMTDGPLRAERTLITSCPPGEEFWKLQMASISLDTEGGHLWARGVKFLLYDYPVFYLPWLYFPFTTRRTTGFLYPRISQIPSGLSLALPYYINLAPNYDLTLVPRRRGNHGAGLESEFRYLGEHSRGGLQGTYFPDDAEYQREADQRKRWVFGWQHHGDLPGDFKVDVDYVQVSDPDYFQDLKAEGLSASNRSYVPQKGSLFWRGGGLNFALGYEDYQELGSTRTNSYRLRPEVVLKGGWHLGPLHWGFDAQHANFEPSDYLIETGGREAERTYFSPFLALSHQGDLLNYRLAVRHRRSRYLETLTEGPEKETRLNFSEASFELGARLSRFFRGRVQTLEPHLLYFYRDLVEDQERHPLFDTVELTRDYAWLFKPSIYSGPDRLEDASRFTLGLRSRTLDAQGRALFTLGIGARVHLKDQRVGLRSDEALVEANSTGTSVGTGDLRRDEDLFKRGTGSLVSEFDWRLSRHWRLTGAAAYDSNLSELDFFRTRLSLRDGPKRLELGYSQRHRERSTGNTSEELDLAWQWRLSSKWRLIGRHYTDLEQEQTLEDVFGFEYSSCCGAFRVLWRRWQYRTGVNRLEIRENSRINFEFEFLDLGAVGQGNLDRFDRDVSGWR